MCGIAGIYKYHSAKEISPGISVKKMLSAILHDTDPVFLKWAIAKIATWQNMYIHKNLLHLHGTADRILPIKNVTANESITGGAHLMVVTNAEEVSAILVKLLNSKI